MRIMKKYLLHIISIAALFFAISGPLFAQTVMGVLREGPAGDPLPGITILVNGSTTGVTTDPDGSYSITVEANTAITLSASTVSRRFYVYPGINLMNLWVNPPSLPSDYDGNYYTTVIIGSQEWMAENLKTTRYINGQLIGLATYPYGEQDGQWPVGGDEANVAKFGRLYSLFTVMDSVCPVGYRIARYGDWKKLTFGADSIYSATSDYRVSLIPVAKTLASKTDWLENEIEGTVGNNPQNNNITGFTALPAGSHLTDGSFGTIGEYGSWWIPGQITMASISADSNNLTLHTTIAHTPSFYVAWADYGNSIRCVRDLPIPTLNTSAVSSITQNTAISGGNISSDGGYLITSRGVCWNTSHNPTISNRYTNEGSGTGSFTSSLTGLFPDSTYYARAFATNGMGTAYGDEVSFTTYKSDAISDVDGNYYNIVAIGSQVWMAENLKATKYNNGVDIPNVTDNSTWDALTTPAFAWYNNDILNKSVYGALYNWYTVETGKLCPLGWHIPTDAQLTQLTNYVGGESVAGGKLKETGTTHWNSPNEGATDEYGFTSLPGGTRLLNGVFYSIGGIGSWWSSSDTLSTYAFHRFVWNNDIRFSRIYDSKTDGFSVRCLQDYPDQNIVTNISDDGIGSLRSAIEYTNSKPGMDTITFNIPGTGPFTINPLSSLPAITDTVIIDGFTQPGASEANSVLQIELNGTKAGAEVNGLTINARYCTIKGLIINQFPGSGIQILNGTGNQISSNSIYSNGTLGINLGADGVTQNDTGDPDTGPNNLQNFPVLQSVSFSTGSVVVTGSLNSEPSGTYDLQFFASKVADDTGYGEGQTYLGSNSVTTDASGNATFSASFSIKGSSGTVITATATDPLGNTSEFSKAIGEFQDQTVGQWPLIYTLNTDGVPNISDGSDLEAVRASFQSWSAISTANIQFTEAATTTSSKYARANDGVNLISFEDDQFPFPYGVLAVAAKLTEIDEVTQVARILDADIVVNPDFVNDIKYNLGVGYNGVNAGYFDIQSVITHEIGHVLGLLHSGVVSSTMFPMIDQGTSVRSLEQDDKSWASYKYPKQPDYNSTYGSISGNIIYGYDNKPVAGALVYAINTSTQDSMHAYSDASGNYLIPGLIPGSYYIYIEPLDGDVHGYKLRPGNISSYIYSNTVYTDYPGEFYSGNGEAFIETNDTKTFISVSAGTTTNGINLITNKDITPPFVVKVRQTKVKENLINILSNFSIRFSEQVDESSLSVTSCYLTDGTNNIGGNYTTLGDSLNVVLFDPVSLLNYSTEYTLHITGDVKDMKGNPLTPEFTKSFTTISKDNVPPAINEVIPANGSTGIFITDKIRVFFSEPMNKSTVENGFTLSWDDAGAIKQARLVHSAGIMRTGL